MDGVTISGDRLSVTFQRFGLEQHRFFLKCKVLPEINVAYDEVADSYSVEAPARFAALLGVADAVAPGKAVNGDVQADVLSGKLKEKDRAAVLERFRLGQSTVLISKASLLGFGLNVQHCKAMVFSGFAGTILPRGDERLGGGMSERNEEKELVTRAKQRMQYVFDWDEPTAYRTMQVASMNRRVTMAAVARDIMHITYRPTEYATAREAA